jgi:hypothetical protein
LSIYEFEDGFYHKECYEKKVPKTKRNPKHELDGHGLYKKFQNREIKCAGCGGPIDYPTHYTTTDQSLGE